MTSAVIRFTHTEGDLQILKNKKIGKQLNAASTKVHSASHLLLTMDDDIIPNSVRQDRCVTQSGYMSIDLLLDM